MANLLTVAQEVAVLFLLMAAGFASRKAKILTDRSIGEVVGFLLMIVNPCLILHAFDRAFEPSMLKGLALAFAFAVAAHLVLMAVSAVLFVRGRPSTDIVLRMSAVFSNAGFVGIPLEQAVLGTEGVFYGVAYIVVFNIFMWSWGLGLNRDGRFTLSRKMVLNPGMLAVIGGVTIFFLPHRLPVVLGEPLEMLAGMNTPLAMAVIGYYLAGTHFDAVLRVPKAHLAVFFRLVVCPALVIAMLWPFRHALDRTMMLAVVIPAATPVAAMVSMFAAKYERDVSMSVAMVSGTTLLSVVTMPLVIAFAMSVL